MYQGRFLPPTSDKGVLLYHPSKEFFTRTSFGNDWPMCTYRHSPGNLTCRQEALPQSPTATFVDQWTSYVGNGYVEQSELWGKSPSSELSFISAIDMIQWTHCRYCAARLMRDHVDARARVMLLNPQWRLCLLACNSVLLPHPWSPRRGIFRDRSISTRSFGCPS
jgi:hypothetical protein